ncbi:two-component system chemotaxis response regulator CheY [Streptohalobacillus salinus]|uniref:Two-component system chemotaxis response regulator CheY n=1 Tax=Streptohalobacillus salinus TaxID=621096 RepID=A0A2V3WH23_9BACI|nr:response regulator [Streptohalobacillus salinus]PXW92704.1 two-component system chemotaxis response regulator CheY [Streptohalobacillus salinus]
MYSVLIVDDSAFMRSWLTRLILKRDYSIAGIAENGFEAILKYRKLNPDLVLLDIHMPELSGIETLKRILSIDKEAKIIMVSAMGTSFIISEAIEIGAKGFVKKPHFDGLLTLMSQALHQSDE